MVKSKEKSITKERKKLRWNIDLAEFCLQRIDFFLSLSLRKTNFFEKSGKRENAGDKKKNHFSTRLTYVNDKSNQVSRGIDLMDLTYVQRAYCKSRDTGHRG